MLSEVSVTSIASHKEFRKILELVSESLNVDITQETSTVNTALGVKEAEGGIPDLRLDSKLMLEIEWCISQILRHLNMDKFGAMQFPANVRILNNRQKNEADNSYKTTYLHCDSWSGAPQDTLNIFLGLFVSDEAPWLRMYKTFPKNHPAYAYVGPYIDAPVEESELVEVPVPRSTGTLVMWPTQTPHKTDLSKTISTQNNSSWRVSIDIRIRANSPYSIPSELTDENFSQSKMNSLGVYWSTPSRKFLTLKEKIDSELEVLKTSSNTVQEARRLYLRKHYGI